MPLRTALRRPEVRILLILVVLAPFLLTPWINADGIGYFGYLRSLVIEGNLDLGNEFEYLGTHIVDDAGGLPGRFLTQSAHTPGIHSGYHLPPPDPVTGRIPSNFSVGPAICWAPAYLVAHGVVKSGNALGLGHRDDGYGGLYYLAFALTSLAGGLIGLLLTFRLASRNAGTRASFWATLGIALASSLAYYLYLAPSFAHALTILTVGAFLLHWHGRQATATRATWFQWGLLTGCLFLLRWNDVVIAVPVFAVAAVRLLRERGLGGRLGELLLRAVLGLAGFLLVALPQLAAWQYFHGRPWVRHSVETFQFSWEGLWGTFLSARHGLFQWTPIVLLAVVGLVLLWRRDRLLAGVSIAALLLLTVTNCTVRDWWGGSGFGMRRLVSAAPIFILGLAIFFDTLCHAPGDALARHPAQSRKTPGGVPVLARICAPLVCVILSLWNLLLIVQYSLGMIDHNLPVSITAIAANQPAAIARLIDLIASLV